MKSRFWKKGKIRLSTKREEQKDKVYTDIELEILEDGRDVPILVTFPLFKLGDLLTENIEVDCSISRELFKKDLSNKETKTIDLVLKAKDIDKFVDEYEKSNYYSVLMELAPLSESEGWRFDRNSVEEFYTILKEESMGSTTEHTFLMYRNINRSDS